MEVRNLEIKPGLRRTLYWSLGGVALAAFVVAIVVTVLAIDSAPAWLVGALVVIILCLIAEIVLFFIGRKREETVAFEPEEEDHTHFGSAKGKDLLLRCSTCSNTYSASDDGRRPLATLCPHCGQRGMVEASAA